MTVDEATEQVRQAADHVEKMNAIDTLTQRARAKFQAAKDEAEERERKNREAHRQAQDRVERLLHAALDAAGIPVELFDVTWDGTWSRPDRNVHLQLRPGVRIDLCVRHNLDASNVIESFTVLKESAPVYFAIDSWSPGEMDEPWPGATFKTQDFELALGVALAAEEEYHQRVAEIEEWHRQREMDRVEPVEAEDARLDPLERIADALEALVGHGLHVGG